MSRPHAVVPLVLAVMLGCGPEPATTPPVPQATKPADAPAEPVSPGDSAESAEPVAEQPRQVGCWERVYGKAPRSSGAVKLEGLSGCPDCAELRAGPKAKGLHVEVLRRLRELEKRLPEPPIEEPVLWINSGDRDGPPHKSMHNQGLAVDIVVCGLDSVGTAKHLRDVGFTCVIEYFDPDGNPCNMAHGDLRNTEWSLGAYARGGRKARSCPRRAVSRGEDCRNQTKAEWRYPG